MLDWAWSSGEPVSPLCFLYPHALAALYSRLVPAANHFAEDSFWQDFTFNGHVSHDDAGVPV